MSSRNTEQAAKEVTDENRNDKSAFILNLQDDFVNKSPVVKLINSLINQAIKLDASDIHIEPFESQIRVRFRVDGDLHEMLTISRQSQSAIVTRIKVMANMNIAEKRLPQDGRIEMKIDNLVVDMRISVIPSTYGEKIVMRILNRGNFLKSKTELGFTKGNLNLFDNIISAPNGIILVSGPTGSGKTTTLYAYLNELNKVNKNIITVEDPVEYKLDGINQVQVNSKIGLSFANGLRSILRQDPDIIMIGEIRDEETAEIAIRAAITGHLVLSTIHTNDASSTIIRLQDMGIKPYLISASLRGVIAQRLVKTICENCKIFYEASSYEKEVLEINDNICEDYLNKQVILYKGEGCPKCLNTGYKGRIAIHEIMNVNRNVKDAIYQSDIEKLNLALQNNGMKTLKDNCKELVLTGMTTLEEYLQVIYRM
jgi:type IV pilus assembly protein PilB